MEGGRRFVGGAKQREVMLIETKDARKDWERKFRKEK